MTPKEIAVGVRDLILEHGWWDGSTEPNNLNDKYCPVTGAGVVSNCWEDREFFYTQFMLIAKRTTSITTWNDALDPATGEEIVLGVLTTMIEDPSQIQLIDPS